MKISDLLFPPRCVGCAQEIAQGALCQRCTSAIPEAQPPTCPHCGLRIPFGDLAKRCRKVLHIRRLSPLRPYRNTLVKEAVDAFKYEGIRDLHVSLGDMLAQTVASMMRDANDTDERVQDILLIPIPLHAHRLRKRGFNQSALLAQYAAAKLNLPYTEQLLLRTKETEAQVKLSHTSRKENVHGAFFARSHPALGTHTVILVDDVITTGATISEAAGALKKEGARIIWAAAVAKG